MTKFFPLASAILLAISAPAAAQGTAHKTAVPSKEMPAELRGNWYEPLDYTAPVCTDDDSGLLQVDASGFTFPMESSRLVSIVEDPIDTYRLFFYEQALTDGPVLPRANAKRQTWTLSPDGESLNIVGRRGMTLDLVRCQPQASEAGDASEPNESSK